MGPSTICTAFAVAGASKVPLTRETEQMLSNVGADNPGWTFWVLTYSMHDAAVGLSIFP